MERQQLLATDHGDSGNEERYFLRKSLGMVNTDTDRHYTWNTFQPFLDNAEDKTIRKLHARDVDVKSIWNVMPSGIVNNRSSAFTLVAILTASDGTDCGCHCRYGENNELHHGGGRFDDVNPDTKVVPIPPSLWLLGSGLFCFFKLAKRGCHDTRSNIPIFQE